MKNYNYMNLGFGRLILKHNTLKRQAYYQVIYNFTRTTQAYYQLIYNFTRTTQANLHDTAMTISI
jgi:hypothetical protein